MKTIPYGHQYVDSNDIKEVIKALRSEWLTQGPKVRDFEESLRGYTRARYAVAVSSGTAALHTACLAAGIKPGISVVTSPITFAASSNAVLYCGGRPLFADVAGDTANIDPSALERKVSKSTKAVIPVHFTGHPADMVEIRRIAKKKGLTVIEDAAHALGAKYRGSVIGDCRYSDMAIFSFHPVKAIASGEGGAITTNSKYLYNRLLTFRNHGFINDAKSFSNPQTMRRYAGKWYHEMQELGFNYRITDIQCALASSQLKKIEAFIKRRREIIDIYNDELSDIRAIDLPTEKTYVRSAWHLYQIRIRPDASSNVEGLRKRFYRHLRREGIGAQIHYIPVYWHPYYRKLGYKEGLCPNAERFYKSVVTIPLFYDLRRNEIDHIVKTIRHFFRRRSG
jgi:UDP-4-amino-4,6-dideoxy-N-acetyl-beta-L-altrosamine transaminase